MPRSNPAEFKPLNLLRTYTACFSADDSLLATLAKDVVVWNVALRSKRYRIHPVKHPSSCDFNRDATHLAIKTTSGRIVTVNARRGDDVRIIDRGSEGEGCNLLYSPCSKFLIDGTWTGSLVARDARTGAVEFQRDGKNEMVKAVHADTGRRTWAVHHCHKCHTGPPQPDYISVWKWPFRKPKIFKHASPFIRAMALSPNAKVIATCAMARPKGYHLTIHTTAHFDVCAELWLDMESHLKQICWSPDGREIVIVRKHEVLFYRFPELALTARFELKYASDVAYSRSGQYTALCGWEGGLLMERAAIQPREPDTATTHA